jgi:glycosyltransferase involved in cell wall biosynthesis
MKNIVLFLPLGKLFKKWNCLGGAEKRLSYIFSRLQTDDISSKIIIRANNSEQELRQYLGKYVKNWEKNVLYFRSSLKLYYYLFTNKPDLVYFDDCMISTLPVSIILTILHVKKVLLFVTNNYSKWTFRKKWHAIIMGINVNLVLAIDTLYPFDVNSLKIRFPKKYVTSTPPALANFGEYQNTSDEKENIILFTSRFVAEKNPILFLNAISSISSVLDNYCYKVKMCGDGPLMDRLIEMSKARNLHDLVKIGKSQNIEKDFSKARIFVSIQQNENYPSQSLLNQSLDPWLN